ncbi:MAG: hypothetical protein HDR09_08455 [Lachnospiraceae bacterium]|nr:hypothetical protein [Lachnospiraceae bacterium]
MLIQYTYGTGLLSIDEFVMLGGVYEPISVNEKKKNGLPKYILLIICMLISIMTLTCFLLNIEVGQRNCCWKHEHEKEIVTAKNIWHTIC